MCYANNVYIIERDYVDIAESIMNILNLIFKCKMLINTKHMFNVWNNLCTLICVV